MSELESKLWEILDSVRGYKDIRDLKDIFISILFLKYANDNWNTNRNRYIIIPKCAQWDYLSSKIEDFYFDEILLKAFNAIEHENVLLYDTFSQFDYKAKFLSNKTFFDSSDRRRYHQSEVGTNMDSIILLLLFGSISDINFIDFKLDFSNVIGDLLERFADYEGKKGGDFTTPQAVSQLMLELLNPKQGTVLDSACGTGGFFQSIENNYPDEKFEFYGQELNSSTLAIARLRFAFSQKNKIQFGEAKSTLEEDSFPDLKADYIIMNPPFNQSSWVNAWLQIDPRFTFGLPPKGNANFAWIQHAIYHLNTNGKATVLMSNGSLSARGKEGEIRKKIIEANLVEAIISLPSKLLANTSIPSCIWILNKNKTNKREILFVDASDLGVLEKSKRVLDTEGISKITNALDNWNSINEKSQPVIGFCKGVDLKEISANDYILSPARYVGIKELNEVDLSNSLLLGDIIKYVRPSRLKANRKYKRISIKDLSSNEDSYFLNTANLLEGELNSNYRVLGNDVLLLSRLGSNIKPTYFKSSKDHLAYTASGIYAFKVDQTKVTLEYLIAELHKGYIKAQIESFRKGAGIPFIRKDDLLGIKIIAPVSLEQQKSKVKKERELRFQSIAKELGFEKEITKLKETQMKDLGSKKHNIMQHLNNVKSSVDVLIKMLELNEGVLRSDQIIDPKRGVTVDKRFLRLTESLNNVIYYVDNLTNETQFKDAEVVNPNLFLNECKERGLQNDLFHVEIIFEKESFAGRDPLISISKNDFEELYNNILENAINHGFIETRKRYIFRITIRYVDDYVEVYFENNGKPFPKGISKNYDVKGEKAGATAGTGIGLWKVAEIAKYFDAELSVFDNPESDFPVGFNFKFNLETA